MIFVLYLAVLTAGLHFAAVALIDNVRRWQELRSFAKTHDCQPTAREKPFDLFGIYKVVTAAWHIIGGTSLPDSIRNFERLGDTYTSKILTTPVVFTCDPRNMRHVLVTAFGSFDASRGIRDHLFRPITAHGIFALDGVEWKMARGLYRDLFSNTRQLFQVELQEKCFQGLVNQIETASKNGAFDLQPLFLRLTMDLTTSFAMGESVDSLCGSRDSKGIKKVEFVQALMYVKACMARDGFLGPMHHLIGKRKFYASCKLVHSYVENVIQDRLAARQRRILLASTNGREGKKNISLDRECLLDGMLETSSDVEQLRDGVVTILIAGIDSVASLLSTTFFLLIRHPNVMHKLRASVTDKIGDDQRPDVEKLRSIHYLRQVFNEAMRVYPPVPFNARTATCDTFLPTGGGMDGHAKVLIQKGQRVIFSSWASHRSLRTFGSDAHTFCPERWNDLKSDELAGFIPFNLGPRACPGQHYALMEASYVTVRILQTFSNIESADSRPWKEHMGLNLSNQNGTVVRMSR